MIVAILKGKDDNVCIGVRSNDCAGVRFVQFPGACLFPLQRGCGHRFSPESKCLHAFAAWDDTTYNVHELAVSPSLF